MTPTWRPLLEGDLAAEAWRVIFEIAEALREPLILTRPWGPASASLADGTGGISLFYSYLAEARDDEDLAQIAFAYVDRMIETLPALGWRPDFYSGFTGVAWVAEHLRGRLLEDDGEDVGEEIDAALVQMLGSPVWTGEYDLISGLAGFGVYALERLPRPAARTLLERILGHLETLAQTLPSGVSWHTPPERLPERKRASYPGGYYNLGLAHGVPALIALLGAAGAAAGSGITQERARPLLAGAVRWLLAQRLPAGALSCFPNLVADTLEPPSSRLAWCYGDPGVATALLLAARRAGEPAWEQEALAIARRAAERPPERAAVVDACLCHGAAGVGHLFNRLYQQTSDERLAEVARFWFRRTLELQRPGEGVAGFLHYAPEEDGTPRWEAAHGFLTGAAGVGLALLAAVSPLEPTWDRALLASAPQPAKLS